MEWHLRSGLVLLGLIVFRVGWGLWGGRYARFGHYWTTPAAFVAHFRRRGTEKAHTSPGVALAVVHQMVVQPSSGEKWGSLKSLEKVLASKIEQNVARATLTPLAGIYELRLADAHLLRAFQPSGAGVPRGRDDMERGQVVGMVVGMSDLH